jgi:hypothetical protein
LLFGTAGSRWHLHDLGKQETASMIALFFGNAGVCEMPRQHLVELEAMTHSYLLVTWQGSVLRVDSDGPITNTVIQSKLGGDCETAEWGAGNSTVTLCFNSGGAQSGLPTNVKFKAKCGNVLIGVYEGHSLRGLTDGEFGEVENIINHSL